MLAAEQSSNSAKRRFGKDEPFEAWARKEPLLDSHRYNISRTDLDVVWSRWNRWMLIEKKLPNGYIRKPQKILLTTVDSISLKDPNYFGLHLLVIETKFPLGKIYLDHKEVTREQLTKFLRWEMPIDWYKTCELA